MAQPGAYQSLGGPPSAKPYDQPPSETRPFVANEYRSGSGETTYTYGSAPPVAASAMADGQRFAASSSVASRHPSFVAYDDEGEQFLNDFVQVEFDDVIREQSGTQSVEKCRTVNNITYTYTKNYWYKFLTLVTGVFLSFMWGFFFATYAYFINWWWAPWARLLRMTIYMWAVLYRDMCRGFMHPLYEAVAIMFSNIRVRFTQKTAVPPQPPAITSA